MSEDGQGVIDWQARAIELWPGARTSPRIHHPFHRIRENGTQDRSIDWPGTQELLKRELGHLDATNVVLELAVSPRQIRADGWIRADATVQDAGVILSFQSEVGPMRYPVDRFTQWKANVRAIALALEALRKVNRYGVAGRAEQYRGWLAIPAQTGGVDPYQLIGKWAGWPVESVKKEPERAYRLARRNAHPDSFEGSADDYKAVLRAGKAIGV